MFLRSSCQHQQCDSWSEYDETPRKRRHFPINSEGNSLSKMYASPPNSFDNNYNHYCHHHHHHAVQPNFVPIQENTISVKQEPVDSEEKFDFPKLDSNAMFSRPFDSPVSSRSSSSLSKLNYSSDSDDPLPMPDVTTHQFSSAVRRVRRKIDFSSASTPYNTDANIGKKKSFLQFAVINLFKRKGRQGSKVEKSLSLKPNFINKGFKSVVYKIHKVFTLPFRNVYVKEFLLFIFILSMLYFLQTGIISSSLFQLPLNVTQSSNRTNIEHLDLPSCKCANVNDIKEIVTKFLFTEMNVLNLDCNWIQRQLQMVTELRNTENEFDLLRLLLQIINEPYKSCSLYDDKKIRKVKNSNFFGIHDPYHNISNYMKKSINPNNIHVIFQQIISLIANIESNKPLVANIASNIPVANIARNKAIANWFLFNYMYVKSFSTILDTMITKTQNNGHLIQNIEKRLKYVEKLHHQRHQQKQYFQTKNLIDKAILKYDADKIGKTDYALESIGGKIVDSSDTYVDSISSLLGFQLNQVIKPNVHPGNCWPMKGSQGYVMIKLAYAIQPTSFTLEHISKSISTNNISSAPTDFNVYGFFSQYSEGFLLGSYTYNVNGNPLQMFPIQHKVILPCHFIQLKILNNNGNFYYTCIYRFRVHGIRI